MIRFHSPQDLHRAGLVARAHTLREVSLVELQAKRSVPFAEAASTKETFSETSISVHDEANGEVRNEGKSLAVRVRFEVALRSVHGATPLIVVSGLFELEYERIVPAATFTGEDVQTFARTNGVYNAWPYMREVVSNSFSRLGYRPYTLDSLVIAAQPEESKAKAPRPTPTRAE